MLMSRASLEGDPEIMTLFWSLLLLPQSQLEMSLVLLARDDDDDDDNDDAGLVRHCRYTKA